jgi:peptide/nickel transport system permease protein
MPAQSSLLDRLLMRGLRRRGLALFCVLLLGVIVLACFLGPFFTHSPSSTSFEPLLPPSTTNLMGTDSLGRDLFARLLLGGQTSLIAGIVVAILCLSIAVAFGAVAGFFGGTVDLMLMRLAEIFQVIPSIILALVAAALWGSSLTIIILILAMTMWPQVARIARTETMRIRELGYVESAFAIGFGPWRILWSDVLPNAFPPLLVATTMTAGRAILLESGLAFLGLGDANKASWGALLNEAQSHLQNAWWLTLFPGLAIFLVVVAINLLGDVWNDNLNPTLNRVK